MTTEQVLPALALSPSGEVTIEEVTAALVFHLARSRPNPRSGVVLVAPRL